LLQAAKVKLKYMMIDKSRAEIAALKELEIHYLSCKFHMAQDWERFMTSSKSGIPVSKSGKKKSPLCHEIRLRLKELQVSSVVQHATSGELAFLMQSVSGAYVQEVAHQSMFTALSNAFKKRLEELKLPAVAKYYEDNWENCAAHWAAWGRTAVKHLRSDTNNLLERFFLRQKTRSTAARLPGAWSITLRPWPWTSFPSSLRTERPRFLVQLAPMLKLPISASILKCKGCVIPVRRL